MYSRELAQIFDGLDRPIVLVGMMGAGKSFLGKRLAEVLGLSFFDTDSLIEERAGLSVSEIFERFGEARFREIEHKTIAEFMARQGACVLATGGGALTNPETLALLKAQGVMLWLNVDFPVMWARIKESRHRPLMKTDDPEETLRRLLENRMPLYVQAPIHIAIGNEKADACVEAMIKALFEYLKKGSV